MQVSPLFVIDIRNEYSHIPVFRSFKQFMAAIANRRLHRGQYRFSFDTQKDYIRLFEAMQSFKNCTILVDEADALFQVRDFERPLVNVLLGSRNHNLNMYFAGKRPFLIPVIVRSQADEYVIFGINEERDIAYLEKRLRSQFPKSPYELQRGEAIIFKDGEKPELVKVPLFKQISQIGKMEVVNQ